VAEGTGKVTAALHGDGGMHDIWGQAHHDVEPPFPATLRTPNFPSMPRHDPVPMDAISASRQATRKGAHGAGPTLLGGPHPPIQAIRATPKLKTSAAP